MVAHEHVEARRVAAPHLEPVDGRERLLDRGVRLGRRPARLAARQVCDGAGGADPVVGDGPHGVRQADHSGVDGLDLGQAVGRVGAVGVEARLDGADGGGQRGAHALDLGEKPAVVHERPHALGSAQVGIGRLDQLGCRGARLDERETSGQGRHRVVQRPDDLV